MTKHNLHGHNDTKPLSATTYIQDKLLGIQTCTSDLPSGCSSQGIHISSRPLGFRIFTFYSMSTAPSYSRWQNNTHGQWWKDAGLRSMMTSLSVVYAASFTFGYDGTLLASLIILPQWSAYFGNPTGNTMGLIAASFYFPKIVAPAVASYCSDRFGRRPSLFVGACFAIAGSLVTCFANTRNMFIGGRVILGWGAGMQEAIAPYVLQELAHPRMRSAIGSSLLSSYFIGTICAGWFGFAVLGWDSDWSWRLLNLLQATGSVWMVVLILLGKMVESPRWLVKVGRVKDAHAVLAKLHANGKMDDELVVNELNEMKEVQSAAEQASQVGLGAFWATTGAKKRLFVVVVAAAGTQLSGSVLISAYLGPILDNVGITDSAAQVALLAGLNMYGFVVLMFVATSVVERYGRRPVWMWSIGLQTVCFIIFTALSGGYEATQNAAIGVATIPFIYLYFGFYVACWSTVAPMYASEILPTMLRSKGIAIYSTVQSVTVTYNQYVNPIAIEAIAWRYYFLFVALQIFFFVYAWFGFKETKGFTMEEVGYVFDGPNVVEEIRRNAGRRVERGGEKTGEMEHDEGVAHMGPAVNRIVA